MSINDLSQVIICQSCGLCCSKDTLCDQCYINTLGCNRLSEDLLDQVKGLKSKSYNHG